MRRESFLIQLLVVFAIFGILAAVGAVGHQGYINSPKEHVNQFDKSCKFAFTVNMAADRYAGSNIMTSCRVAKNGILVLEVGETATAKIKYESKLLPSGVSGATLALSSGTATKTELRKVSPDKTHIYATDDA